MSAARTDLGYDAERKPRLSRLAEAPSAPAQQDLLGACCSRCGTATTALFHDPRTRSAVRTVCAGCQGAINGGAR